MQQFRIPIEKNKFRALNSPWNKLMLNSPWSVGYVSMLIELKVFKDKQEWEDFYYEMGEYRNKKLNELPKQTIDILNDEELIRKNKSIINSLPKPLQDINFQNGRTEEQLRKKAEILFEFIHQKHPEISKNDCFEAIKYRVIGETWNGIILREHNTIKTLKKTFTTATFIKKEGQFDYDYAVDYELYISNKLVCGIQIKPKSYTYNTPYINRAKSTNETKNKKYSFEFNAPVFDVISSTNGTIINKIVIGKINSLLM